ncbi:MAG: division/cell wall cluster transcriptional repressor MraZ [Pseudomonadota bacterium]
MDRFVSRFVNRVDAKGRVSVPASFRAILSRAVTSNSQTQPLIYAAPVSELTALDCGGEPFMDEISSLMAGLAAFSEERDLLSTELLGGAQELRVDADGRIILPKDLRLHAAITDQAVFVGLGHKFQIWSPDGFAVRQKEAAARVRELKALLGRRSPDASSVPPVRDE